MTRYLYVLGPSYCGSTLLSGMLNNLPGVGSPGELHWFIDRPGAMTRCTVHGDKCPFPAAVSRPGLTPTNLYARAAEALGVQVLVSTDKSTGHALRFLPWDEADGILLFKEPEPLIASFRRHLPGLSFSGARELYAATYENRLQFLRSGFFQGGAIVRYSELATNPAAIPKLCAALKLPNPTGAISFPPLVWHNIGGNVTSYQDVRYASQRVLLDERWRTELTQDEQRIIAVDPRIQSVRRAALQAVTV